MGAVFGYGRVSTAQQFTENQRLELEGAGHRLDFWFEDVGVSGSTLAALRPEFGKLLDRIRSGETLLVSKLDRLGRDAIDVQQTVRTLGQKGIRVVVHSLGNQDLTSSTGKLLLTMLAAVAEMERDLLIERTQAGLARAKAQGRQLGRPLKTTAEQRSQIQAALGEGVAVSAVARQFNVSRGTVINIRERAPAAMDLA